MSERTKFTIGRVTFYSGRKRSKTERMGRFGGGWQWKLGITTGSWSRKYGVTILVALLVDEYRITISPKEKR
jgi:hypothetical protein